MLEMHLPLLCTSQITRVPDTLAVPMLNKLAELSKAPAPTGAQLYQLGWQAGKDSSHRSYYCWPGHTEWVQWRARVERVLESLGQEACGAALAAAGASQHRPASEVGLFGGLECWQCETRACIMGSHGDNQAQT